MTRALAAIDAELTAIDRRFAVAVMNEAPDTTRQRLYWERVHLVREWARAQEVPNAPDRERRAVERRQGERRQ